MQLDDNSWHDKQKIADNILHKIGSYHVKGTDVNAVNGKNGKKYLRTDANQIEADNLGNL